MTAKRPPTEAALNFLGNPTFVAALAFVHVNGDPGSGVEYPRDELNQFAALYAVR